MLTSWIRAFKQWLSRGNIENESRDETIQDTGATQSRTVESRSQAAPNLIEGKVTYIYAREEKEDLQRLHVFARATLGEQREKQLIKEQTGEELRERLSMRIQEHRRPSSRRVNVDDRQEQKDEKREDQSDLEQRKRFQGTLKQAIPSPSPIYGYRKGERKESDEAVQIEEPTYKRTESERNFVNAKESPIFHTGVSEDELNGIHVQEANLLKTENKQHPSDVDDDRIRTLEEDNKKESVPKVQDAEIEEQLPHSSVEEKTDSYSSDRATELPNAGLNGTGYSYPDVSLLSTSATLEQIDYGWMDEQAQLLLDTFSHFNLKADLLDIVQGPTLTRFEVQPAPGIKINKFTNLQDDLKLALAAKEIRMEAPIPGKHAIGIEIPHPYPKPVFLGDLIQTNDFQEASSPLTVCLGAGIDGTPVFTDIQKMPHGLIAGATGSGKSVCINSLIVSLLYKASPEQLRLLLIDPKMVEMMPYQNIPHLVTPVITDPKRATVALKWAVEEMERRYQLFAQEGVRDLEKYNSVFASRTGEEHALPYIVIIIDELADLMMVAPGDVEDAICRLTQKARACGIHLIVATQRPSVDVITGLIKSNIPTRIAFAVSSQVDSRTILDTAGAERLLGKGDMLYLGNGSSKPIRVQGNFVSDDEILAVVKRVSNGQHFLFTQEELVQHAEETEEEDELIEEALFHVLEQGNASTSSLQRKFRIGYNRAARMIDWMEKQGMISEAQGSKPRNVIWSQEQFLQWLDQRP